jgi:signal transduction histidine kinase
LKKDDDTSVCEKDCPALQVWNTGEAVFRTDTCFMNKKSHKRIQLSTSYAPIKDYQGKMAGAICVFRDVTKEKEVERLRNEFVSTASHELRTPITATEGYLSIVTDSGMVKIDDKGKEFVGKAKNTLMSMSKLIQNLLAVTKIEEGKLETNITNFSIHDLSKEVIGVFTAKAKEKGIGLTLVDSKDLTVKGKKVIGRSLNVHADMEMIREVLNNLVENAIKFTVKGGVTVSIDYDEEFATINIEDTGMGMSSDGQKHLFEKFYRVDNTATREVGGTGLGLYITRSIVETFGGRIWVESSQGKGSKFHFTVPLSLD